MHEIPAHRHTPTRTPAHPHTRALTDPPHPPPPLPTPKVALNQPYNEMVDTYSFSMVLWEMLHKRKPFAGMNVDTHRQVVCRDGVRPEIDNSRPRDLTQLFTQSWHQDLDCRPNFSSIVRQIEGMLHEAFSEKAASATMKANGKGGSFRGRLGSMFGSRKKDGASTWF